MNREKLLPLAALLDLMEVSQSHKLKIDHLDTICQRFAVDAGESVDVSFDCPHHPNHSISPLAFMLLEEVNVDEVEIVRINIFQSKDSFLSALRASMVSQHKIVEELFVVSVLISTSQSAHTFHTLVEHSQAIYIANGYKPWCMLKEKLEQRGGEGLLRWLNLPTGLDLQSV